jgi:hypothetical protein
MVCQYSNNATEYIIGVSFQAGVALFCLYHLVQTGTEIPTTCYWKNIRALCQKGQCPGHNANYSHPSTTEVKNVQEVYISSHKTLRGNYNLIFTFTLRKWAFRLRNDWKGLKGRSSLSVNTVNASGYLTVRKELINNKVTIFSLVFSGMELVLKLTITLIQTLYHICYTLHTSLLFNAPCTALLPSPCNESC